MLGWSTLINIVVSACLIYIGIQQTRISGQQKEISKAQTKISENQLTVSMEQTKVGKSQLALAEKLGHQHIVPEIDVALMTPKDLEKGFWCLLIINKSPIDVANVALTYYAIRFDSAGKAKVLLTHSRYPGPALTKLEMKSFDAEQIFLGELLPPSFALKEGCSKQICVIEFSYYRKADAQKFGKSIAYEIDYSQTHPVNRINNLKGHKSYDEIKELIDKHKSSLITIHKPEDFFRR